MSYKSKSTWQTDNAGRYTPGVKKWNGQEQEDHLQNLSESIQWNDAEQTLTDGATITWDYSAGGEAKVTLGGNRTLSIINLPTDRVVYGCLKVIQDGTGGRTLTLPGSVYKATIGSLLTTAGAVSEITFRYDGSNFSFKIS
jgi:hypothetical protein